MIYQILREHPESRNSDSWLTCKLWATFYPTKIKRDADGKNPSVALKDILDLPREDHIKRIRAIIQNEEGKFLPTSLEVARQRKINEETWRTYIQGHQTLFENV